LTARTVLEHGGEGKGGWLQGWMSRLQFRETHAYPLVVRLTSLPSDLLDSLCGDFITGDLGQVLASVSGGQLAGIQYLIENEATDEWVRGRRAEQPRDAGSHWTKEPR
jgi:hypothetical protein